MKKILTITVSAALAACVSFDEAPVKIDLGMVAEIPPSRAAALLNRYTMPEEAMQLVIRKARVQEGLIKQGCVFGEQSTRLNASQETFPNNALRIHATRITGAARVGEQDGISFNVRPVTSIQGPGGTTRNCFLGFFPAGYPEAALQRELQRLATATTAIGIKQGE